MSIKARFRSGNIEYFESTTQQVVEATAPVFFHHQFNGQVLDVTNTWKAIDVGTLGTTTPAVVDGVGGGVCRLLMDTNDEPEDSGIYMNDIRVFDLNADLVCEFRVDAAVVMGTGVRCVFGMAGDHNLDKEAITEAAWFSMSASAVLNVETDDTTNNTDAATGITMAAGTVYICKIDFRTLADVKFYIDGARVAASTTFDMSNLSTSEAMMQPYASLDKAGGLAALGTLDISDVKIWSDETA